MDLADSKSVDVGDENPAADSNCVEVGEQDLNLSDDDRIVVPGLDDFVDFVTRSENVSNSVGDFDSP